MKHLIATIFTLFTLLLASPSLADEFRLGDLVIQSPIARATVPGATVGAGYLIIKNEGKTADRLVSIATEFSGMAQIHSMKMENNVMMMAQIAEGVPVEAGASIKFSPGGNHLMFMKLKGALKLGEKRTVTLNFEKAGAIEITFVVKSLAETMKMK